MDDYIDERRKRGNTSLIQRLFKKPVSEQQETRPLMNEEVEKELKELAQEEERHFKKEQGFFARLFGKKPKEPTQEEIDALAASNAKVAEEQPTIPEDVKEAIRTLHRWLKKLPAKRLEEFKASEEFQQYKEVLTKYGMVRKKEENVEGGG